MHAWWKYVKDPIDEERTTNWGLLDLLIYSCTNNDQ